MFRIGKSLSVIILTIIFLGLAGVASVFYNADKQQQKEMADNELFNKSKSLINITTEVSNSLANNKLSNHLNKESKAVKFIENSEAFFKSNFQRFILSSNNKKEINQDVTNYSPPNTKSSFTSEKSLEDLRGLIGVDSSIVNKGQKIINNFTITDLDPEIVASNFWRYEKNDHGAEIILRSNNGMERRIMIPFKFLSN